MLNFGECDSFQFDDILGEKAIRAYDNQNQSNQQIVQSNENLNILQGQPVLSEYNQNRIPRYQNNYIVPMMERKRIHPESVLNVNLTNQFLFNNNDNRHQHQQLIRNQNINPSSMPIQQSANKRKLLAPEEHSNKKRKPVLVPEDQKDEQYWERRRKNNESAKRSRLIRRAREQDTLWKIAQLEAKNMELLVELNVLKEQIRAFEQAFRGKKMY